MPSDNGNAIIFKGFALFQKALPIIITSSKSSTSTNKANILAKFSLRCHQLWLLTDKFSFRNLSFTDNIYDWAVTCWSTIWLVAFCLIVFAQCAQWPLSLIRCQWPICRLSSWQKHQLTLPPQYERAIIFDLKAHRSGTQHWSATPPCPSDQADLHLLFVQAGGQAGQDACPSWWTCPPCPSWWTSSSASARQRQWLVWQVARRQLVGLLIVWLTVSPFVEEELIDQQLLDQLSSALAVNQQCSISTQLALQNHNNAVLTWLWMWCWCALIV